MVALLLAVDHSVSTLTAHLRSEIILTIFPVMSVFHTCTVGQLLMEDFQAFQALAITLLTFFSLRSLLKLPFW